MRLNSDMGARIRYLSLALFSRKVVDALSEYLDKGAQERLASELPTYRDYLKAFEEGLRPGRPPAVRAMTHYEQVRTLDEVRNKYNYDLSRLASDLEVLSTQGVPRKEKRKRAEEARKFFALLETQALRKMDQSRQPPPRDIRELCEVP